MTREEIKKAAQEKVKRLANIAYEGGRHIGQDDLETAFESGVEWFINHLFHKTKDEVPKLFGHYENEIYPQIPCIVLGNLSTGYGYGVRYWNAKEQVWDDEQCDDYECDKYAIEEWCYLDDLTQSDEA